MLKNGTPASPATARDEQRLAGARRPDQQHAARNARAERGELLRVLQELDDFDQLLLGFVDAGDVGEGDRRLVAGEHAGRGSCRSDIAWLFVPCAWRIMKTKMPIRKSVGSRNASAPASRPSGWPA